MSVALLLGKPWGILSTSHIHMPAVQTCKLVPDDSSTAVPLQRTDVQRGAASPLFCWRKMQPLLFLSLLVCQHTCGQSMKMVGRPHRLATDIKTSGTMTLGGHCAKSCGNILWSSLLSTEGKRKVPPAISNDKVRHSVDTIASVAHLCQTQAAAKVKGDTENRPPFPSAASVVHGAVLAIVIQQEYFTASTLSS